MKYLSGEFVVELKKFNGESDYQAIPGRDFGLEEGGDWEADRDEGTPKAGFLLISFQDNYDVLVDFNMYGDTVTRYHASIRIQDEEGLKEEGIASVRIFQNNLQIEVTAPSEVDY
jgi:hypothetical protein